MGISTSSTSLFEMDSESYDRLNAFVLIFISLFSGCLYSNRPSSRYPILGPYLLLVVSCVSVLALFYYSKLQPRIKSISMNKSNLSTAQVFTDKPVRKVETVEVPPRSFIEVNKGDVKKACAAYTSTLE